MLKSEVTNISAELALTLLEIIISIGEQPADILARAGIIASMDDFRRREVAIMSRKQFASLFREVILVLEHDTLRRGSVPSLTNEETKMLCYCIIHQKTLGAVIEQAIKFFEMLRGRGIALALDCDGGYARFEFILERNQQSASALVCDLLALSYYHRFFNWLIGENIAISELCVSYSKMVSQNTLIDLFHFPVRFNQSGNYFDFSSEVLDRPVIRTPDELDALLVVFPFDLFFDGVSRFSLSDAICQLFRRLLTKREPIPNLEQLAAFYNLSTTTFRRRLKSENSSISLIKEQCRKELALELLANETATIDDIASKLGFSDASSFRRSFKGWLGVSPSDYRRATMSGH